MLRHVGDIAASRVLQVGNQSHPRLRIPLLDYLLALLSLEKNVLSLLGLYILESRIFLLLSPFVALVRHPDVEF